MRFLIIYLILLIVVGAPIFGQEDPPLADSLKSGDNLGSKFDRINSKIEAAFKIIPVPVVSYSKEAGNTVGLAKFNAFRLNKNDTISGYSKVSEVFTISTRGNINASVSTILSFYEDKCLVLGFINFRKSPEYIFGIGNDVDIEGAEEISTSRLKFANTFLYKVYSDFYVGIGVDITNTFDIKKDSTSFLVQDNYPGKDGGTTTGIGIVTAWDSRDNRYNPHKGSYMLLSYLVFRNITGSGFNYSKVRLDLRKYHTPWYKHVIALQIVTDYSWGKVPFYDLSMLGGEEQMRGYYKGALRDYSLVTGQIEYRVPVWKVFGVTGWVGSGRVANNYQHMAFNGLKLNYGFGFRIKVDSESDINLRMDFGFGPNGIKGFYFNFAEAF